MKKWGLSQRLWCSRKTITMDPAGRFSNSLFDSIPFAPRVCFRSKEIIFCAWIFENICFASSITRTRFSWSGAGRVLAGPGMAPKTISYGHNPSDPILQLTARNDISIHCLSVVSVLFYSRILLYAARSGARYRSSMPLVPGDSIGA